MSPPIGVVVMAHGTPATSAEIEPFYTSIRRGHPPTAELLADLTSRYEALGGTSPLAARTRAQVDRLSDILEATDPGVFTVRYGAKHTAPTIEDAVVSLMSDGIDRAVGIVLTPHHSSLGSGEYLRRAAETAAATAPPMRFAPIRSWHRAPGFARLLADRTASALATFTAAEQRQTAVFFTAHSLPQRAIDGGDTYPDQVNESASDIASLLGLDRRTDLEWGVAWQSAGRTSDPWIGPDLLEEIRRVAAAGATSVVACPVGFVSDHLEILFDLDIEAAGLARSLGLAFARTPSLNDDPHFLAVLAGVVRSAAASLSDPGTLSDPAPLSEPGTSGAGA